MLALLSVGLIDYVDARAQGGSGSVARLGSFSHRIVPLFTIECEDVQAVLSWDKQLDVEAKGQVVWACVC